MFDVNSPMTLAEQHIATRIGNAQRYEWELFVRDVSLPIFPRSEGIRRLFPSAMVWRIVQWPRACWMVNTAPGLQQHDPDAPVLGSSDVPVPIRFEAPVSCGVRHPDLVVWLRGVAQDTATGGIHGVLQRRAPASSTRATGRSIRAITLS